MDELKLIRLYYYICEEQNQFLRWNVQRFSKKLTAYLPIVLGDCMPILTCSYKRSGKVATPLTNKGYGATKNLYYYGVKLHALALKRAMPLPCFLTITPASVHDLTALRPVLEKNYAHITVLDKASCDKELERHMLAHGNALLKPMKEKKVFAYL